jgi:hypothetical protein
MKFFEGYRTLGFLDTMTITKWEPPYSCLVTHTGGIVQESGGFDVVASTTNESKFLWSGELTLPFRGVGKLGWFLIRPFFHDDVKESLTRFAVWVERTRDELA